MLLNGSRKNGLVVDRLDARIEGREPQILERLGPPERHQAPTHLDELVHTAIRHHDIDGVGWADVEAGLEVRNRRRNRQTVQRVDLRPGVVSGEASAHRMKYTGYRKSENPAGGRRGSQSDGCWGVRGELQPPSLKKTYWMSVSGEFRQTRFLFRHLGQSGGQCFFNCGRGPP